MTGRMDVFTVDTLNKEGFRKILLKLVEYGGSDVFIKSGHRVSFKKHGVKQYVTERILRHDEVTSLLNTIQQSGDANKVGAGNPIDFAYTVINASTGSSVEDIVFRVHCGVFSGNKGMVMSIRAIDPHPKTADEIGLDKSIVNTHLISGKGVGFICGDTGSGKSTTLASLNAAVLINTDKHLVTYEDPIETNYDSLEGKRTDCTQYLVGHDVSSFAQGVVYALRQNPDYIMIGEARDEETISAVLQAAETGHSVSTTFHVSRGYDLFLRAMNLFPASQANYVKTRLADLVNYIVFQVLVPTTNGKQMALRETLVIDGYMRKRLLECDVNDISTVLFDLFNEYGTLIENEARIAYENSLISQDKFNELMFKYDVNSFDKAAERVA